jgi:hypothetical protein
MFEIKTRKWKAMRLALKTEIPKPIFGHSFCPLSIISMHGQIVFLLRFTLLSIFSVVYCSWGINFKAHYDDGKFIVALYGLGNICFIECKRLSTISKTAANHYSNANR